MNKEINKTNSTLCRHKGSAIELHTNLDLHVGDIIGLPTKNGISEERIVEIRDLLTDDDRGHGDIINKHCYHLITIEIWNKRAKED